MEAIILAGGFGTRLHELTKETPKPMIEVAGRPFLTYIMDELVYYGFTHVVLAVHYLKEIIIDYFGDNYKGIKIDYSIEDEPLGTGGGILKASRLIESDKFFVINGDTLAKVDYKEMSKCPGISIAVKEMFDFDRYGEVVIKNNLITSFNEKRKVERGFINTGIYYLDKKVFSYINKEKFSVEKDLFEPYMKELSIEPFITDGYFIDIGIKEDYEKAQTDLKREKYVFLDRDGVVNIDKGHVCKIEDFEFTPYIFNILNEYKNKGYKFVIITNQAGIAKNMYTVEDYFILDKYVKDELLKRGYKIEKSYYCPHKDEDNCNCRKPKPGMFLDAIHDLNIDVDNSVAFGDKMGDLIAAHRAGVTKLYFIETRYEHYPTNFPYIIYKVK